MANTITQWRPGTWINSKWRSFPTYRELKKNILNLIHENGNEIIISRSRRGQWGEWSEVWTISNGKPTKIREYWN